MSAILTIGSLRLATGRPEHKVRYALQSRGIQPVTRAGRIRLYDDQALEQLKAALAAIDQNVGGSVRRAK